MHVADGALRGTGVLLGQLPHAQLGLVSSSGRRGTFGGGFGSFSTASRLPSCRNTGLVAKFDLLCQHARQIKNATAVVRTFDLAATVGRPPGILCFASVSLRNV